MRKSLTYSKMLEETGISREQAKAHIEILEKVLEEETVAKSEIQLIHLRMATMESDIRELKSDVKEIREELKLLTRRVDRLPFQMGLMVASSTAITISVLKLTL